MKICFFVLCVYERLTNFEHKFSSNSNKCRYEPVVFHTETYSQFVFFSLKFMYLVEIVSIWICKDFPEDIQDNEEDKIFRRFFDKNLQIFFL